MQVFTNVDLFSQYLKNLSDPNVWEKDNVTLSTLTDLFNKNEQLILNQKENPVLQKQLVDLKNRVKEKFHNQEAEILALKLTNLAQGLKNEPQDKSIISKNEPSFTDLVKEIHKLTNMPSSEMQKIQPQINSIIHQLYTQFQKYENKLHVNDLLALKIVGRKLYQISWADGTALREIDQLGKNQKINTLSIKLEKYKDFTPEAFWKHLSEVLKRNPKIQIVEVEGNREYQREDLLAFISLNPQTPPENLRKKSYEGILKNFKDDYKSQHQLIQHIFASRVEDVAKDLANPSFQNFAIIAKALATASISGNVVIAKQLLNLADSKKINEMSTWKDTLTQFMWGSALHGELEIVMLLLLNSAKTHYKDNNYTFLFMLHRVYAEGHPDVVKLLVDFEDTANYLVKDSILISEVAAGHEENVQLLINSCVDVNKGPKSPLLLAVQEKKWKIAEMLITAGAEVNKADETGDTVLMKAVYAGQVEIVEQLVKAGAKVDLYDKDGRTVYTLIKQVRPSNHKISKKLIEPLITPEIRKHTKFYNQTKLLAHTFQFKGKSNYENKEVKLEGNRSETAAKSIARSLNNPFLPRSTNLGIGEMCAFATEQNNHTADDILQRIREGKPTLILTGFTGHASAVLIWGNNFILCDRGGPSNITVSADEFNPNNLDKESIELLLNSDQSEENYVEVMGETVPKRLGFSKNKNLKLLESLVDIPFQEIGNCSWAALEGIIKTFILVDQLKNLEGLDVNLSLNAKDKIDITDRLNFLFAQWLYFQQLQLLDKFIDHEYDKELVNNCLEKLWNAQLMYPKVFTDQHKELLGSIEEKIKAKLPFLIRQDFKIGKVGIQHGLSMNKTKTLTGALLGVSAAILTILAKEAFT